MANVILEEQTLMNIANSIRFKSNSNANYTIYDMAPAINNISTSSVRTNDASYLFYNGARLNDINNYINMLDNITNTTHMFANCNTIVNNVPIFDTSHVTCVDSMFWGCSNLNFIEYYSYDFSNVTSMHGIFSYCTNLIVAPNFNTINVTNISLAFQDCTKLNVAVNLCFNNATYAYGTFINCVNLTSVGGLNLNSMTNMMRMFTNCNKLSDASYANITNMLPLASNLTNQYVSNMGLNLNRFTTEQLTILSNKGYLDVNLNDFSNEYQISYNLL